MHGFLINRKELFYGMGPCIFGVVFTTLILGTVVRLFEGHVFNRNLTGVDFFPYIQAEDMLSIPAMSTYTFENIKAMLEVVSTKFSRVLIMSVDTYAVLLDGGASLPTNYNSSNARARTAEAAALINRQRNKLSLTVLIGIWDNSWSNKKQISAEVAVALEALQITESIFPGTVEGMFLSNYDAKKVEWARETLKEVKAVQGITSHLGIRLGTKQNCEHFVKQSKDSNSTEFVSLTKEILLNSDFVICEAVAGIEYNELDAVKSFTSIQQSILRNRAELKLINSNMEVMLYTFWRENSGTTKKIDTLRDYWFIVDKFATEYNYTSWLQGSFDNTRLRGYIGWWKLTRNSLINNASGYVEKISISQLAPAETANYESIIYGVYSGTITFAIFLTGCLYLVYRKWHSCRYKNLTREEINEFMNGVPENESWKHLSDELTLNGVALTIPYDKLLELSKDKLQILSNEILGGGKFGWVFKAIVKDATGNEMAVALKVAKPNSVPALRGILSEIKILSYLGPHPNINPFVGACTAELEIGVVYLATELCRLGSLESFLRDCRKTADEKHFCTELYNNMVRWSYEIACGMEYLEQKQVIHLDLATRNVLLSSENVARITDFGLSRRLYEHSSYSKKQEEPLPWRWMAIESLKMLEFSIKSDV